MVKLWHDHAATPDGKRQETRYNYREAFNYDLFCLFFNSFFCDEAAALFPKRNREVRLSAPVFREM